MTTTTAVLLVLACLGGRKMWNTLALAVSLAALALAFYTIRTNRRTNALNQETQARLREAARKYRDV